jgi:signal transduction histidine kinase
MAVESLVVWLESVTFLPLLQGLVSEDSGQSFETTSVVSLLQWAWTLLLAIASSGAFPLVGIASQSLAMGLVAGMLILLAVPLVAGALVFSSMVVRKVRILQEQRERELEQIEQQRSQFVTDIAHDLRTPLMAISGMSHALADGLVHDEAQRDEYLRSICDKSDKMGVLVNAVFDYSKLGSGSFELHREEIDLAQLLLREAAVAYTDAEDADMFLTTCISEERCTVYADQVQLARVVANLISNAIRHNQPGTEVAVILVRQAAAAYAIVADSGTPITGNADDLFQPFAQGDAVRSDTRAGSGLGLSICKRVADMHGFDLAIVQPYGRFTKAFVLQCPVKE